MTVGNLTGLVYLSSGRWVRSDVRRYPTGTCPSCGHAGALKRNMQAHSSDPAGWVARKHRLPGTAERCPGTGVVVVPVVLPAGWND